MYWLLVCTGLETPADGYCSTQVLYIPATKLLGTFVQSIMDQGSCISALLQGIKDSQLGVPVYHASIIKLRVVSH